MATIGDGNNYAIMNVHGNVWLGFNRTPEKLECLTEVI